MRRHCDVGENGLARRTFGLIVGAAWLLAALLTLNEIVVGAPPAVSRWEKLRDMPEPLGRFVLVTDQRNIYRLGGVGFNIRGGQAYGNEFWRYQPSSSQWQKLRPVPFGTGCALAAWWPREAKVIAIAGIRELGGEFQTDGATVGIYDPSDDEWVVKEYACQGLGRLDLLVWMEQSKFLLLSQNGHIAVLDLDRGSLEKVGDYPKQGGTIGAGTIGDVLYVLESESKNPQILHVDLQRARLIKSQPFDQFKVLWIDPIFAYRDRLYLWRNGKPTEDVWSYQHTSRLYSLDPKTGLAEPLHLELPAPGARRSSAGVVCGGCLYIMGGQREDDEWVSDIWRYRLEDR